MAKDLIPKERASDQKIVFLALFLVYPYVDTLPHKNGFGLAPINTSRSVSRRQSCSCYASILSTCRIWGNLTRRSRDLATHYRHRAEVHRHTQPRVDGPRLPVCQR